MSLSFSSHPLIPHPEILTLRPQRSKLSTNHRLSRIKCQAESQEHRVPLRPKWENLLSAAASLYPLYVTVGGAVACIKPAAFLWFVERGPFSYSCALGFIMLAMGLTLELKDLFALFRQRPLSILFGCAAQYTIMPAFGAIVTLIAQGDVPLSIVMTVCTTLGAVLLTPLLTKILAGAYVPVDALMLSLSTLQVVVAPILLGSYMQSTFPSVVKVITPFAPLLAVLTSSLLACSVFSENVVRLKSSIINSSRGSELVSPLGIRTIFCGEFGLTIFSVLLLHVAGFLVGYLAAAFCGFRERQRRAISIEIGMQNSSLGVVLATAHFSSALVALPPALSAVIMNIMGSTLGFIWRYVHPSDTEDVVKSDED